MGAPNSPRARRKNKTGPGRGQAKNESIEDSPGRVMNPAHAEAKKRGDKAADTHPMTTRLRRRQLRHLRNHIRRNALGPELHKVSSSKNPGKHRVGKVRSM